MNSINHIAIDVTYSLSSFGLMGSRATNSPKQSFTLDSVHSAVTPLTRIHEYRNTEHNGLQFVNVTTACRASIFWHGCDYTYIHM